MREGEFGNSQFNLPDDPSILDPSAYKILVVGDIGTGKTSLVKRLVSDTFVPHYKSTIGVDFAVKKLDVNGKQVSLHLWDIAGQGRYGNMTRIYYQGAQAALVVFDVTRTSTFEGALKWKADIFGKVTYLDTDFPIPVILLANKIDLLSSYMNKTSALNILNHTVEAILPGQVTPLPLRDEDEGWGVPPTEMNDYCEKNGFAAWFETSAKDNVNIVESMTKLVECVQLLEKGRTGPRPVPKPGIKLDEEPVRKVASSDCC